MAKPIDLGWRDLRKINLKTGKIPGELLSLQGKSHRIAGYVVPLLDFNWQNLNEFLLVPTPTACIHTPPPPANQMIYVRMQKGKSANFQYGEPVYIIGTLIFEKEKSPYGTVAIQMQGESTEKY
ncbi:MAG: DUF3299 domain-containing protein [Leptospiraceae bacterium]|nr:DUF3299 domain-containing protein [Leptospiraceae bacterium]